MLVIQKFEVEKNLMRAAATKGMFFFFFPRGAKVFCSISKGCYKVRFFDDGQEKKFLAFFCLIMGSRFVVDERGKVTGEGGKMKKRRFFFFLPKKRNSFHVLPPLLPKKHSSQKNPLLEKKLLFLFVSIPTPSCFFSVRFPPVLPSLLLPHSDLFWKN